jgi:hypothetical protein
VGEERMADGLFAIEPKFDGPAFKEALTDLQRNQLPFATVVALSRTAFSVVTAEQGEMRRVFNAPVEWTLNSMQVDQATKANPIARVRFKDERVSAGHYLLPHVLGGGRQHSMFEGRLIRHGIMRRDQWAVPVVGAERDGSGNLNPGQIMKILSDLETVETATAYPGGRNQGVRRDEVYFATTTGGHRTAHLKPGIYKREAGRGLKPVFIFTSRAPTYRAIFDFAGVARRTADREFMPTLWRALEDAVASSNYRGKWTRR